MPSQFTGHEPKEKIASESTNMFEHKGEGIAQLSFSLSLSLSPSLFLSLLFEHVCALGAFRTCDNRRPKSGVGSDRWLLLFGLKTAGVMMLVSPQSGTRPAPILEYRHHKKQHRHQNQWNSHQHQNQRIRNPTQKNWHSKHVKRHRRFKSLFATYDAFDC